MWYLHFSILKITVKPVALAPFSVPSSVSLVVHLTDSVYPRGARSPNPGFVLLQFLVLLEHLSLGVQLYWYLRTDLGAEP